MSNSVTSGGVRPEGLVRAAGSGLIAAVLGGWLMVSMLAQPLESPAGTTFGAIVLTALTAALSYRHVGGMISAGAVLAGLGMVQLFSLQGDLLRDGQMSGHRVFLDSSVVLLSLGCILLGAGVGWSFTRSLGAARWSHYSVLQMVGALVLGAVTGWVLVRFASLLHVSDGLVSWGIVPVIAGAALAFGAVPALSPTGMLPALAALGATAFLSDAPFWGSPTMVIGLVLLAVLVHFVGPMRPREDVGWYGTEPWDAWISRGERSGDEAEPSR